MIIIFGAQSSRRPFAASSRMADMLQGVGNSEVLLCYYEDVVFEIVNSRVRGIVYHKDREIDLRQANIVYLRNMVNEPLRSAIARYCDFFGVRVVNSENLAIPLTTKLSQYIVAALHGIAVPNTVFCDDIDRLVSRAEKVLCRANGYVIKSISGSNGNYNTKLLTLSVDDIDTDQQYVVQEFVPNSFEYRIIVVDGEVVLAYKKINTGKSYQNNITKGGERGLVEIDNMPRQACDYAIQIASLAGREVAGVDIVESSGGSTKNYLLFEINFSYGHPGFDPRSEQMRNYALMLNNFLNKRGN